MSRNKKERAEERRKMVAQQTNWMIGGLSAAIIGVTALMFSIEPAKSARPKNPTAAAEAEPEKKESWPDFYYPDGVTIEEVSKFSAWYRREARRSRHNPISADKELREFQKKVKFEGYTPFIFSAKYHILKHNLEKLNSAYKEVFLKQHRLKETAQHAAGKIWDLDDKGAQDLFLNMAFYVNRASRLGGGTVDTLGSDTWRQDIADGEADCKVHSMFTLFNYFTYATRFGRKDLIPRVRAAAGFAADSNTPHMWLETLVDGEWKIMECNDPGHNDIHRTEFDPEKRYWESALQDPEASRGYRRIMGITYDPKSDGYRPVALTLPAVLDRGMKAMGWKPKSPTPGKR